MTEATFYQALAIHNKLQNLRNELMKETSEWAIIIAEIDELEKEFAKL